MCDPLSIGVATFALGATQAVSSYVGQNAMAKANKEAANYNYAREIDAVNRQDSQLQQENSQQHFDTALTSLKARGDIAASASDMGLSSSSLISQVNANMFGVGRQASIEQRNFDNQRYELANSRVDADVRRVSQINKVPKATVASLVLGIGQAGLSAVNASNAASKAGQ